MAKPLISDDIMGSHRTAAPGEQGSLPARGPKADRQPKGSFGDFVRSANGNPVRVPSARTRLGLRHDQVAAARSMAKVASVEKGARELAGLLAGCGQDRLVAGGRRIVLDPCFARGKKTDCNPTDRGRNGSKHHIATDANGIPLAATLTGANEHDVTHMIPLVDAIPAVRGKPGRPRRRPERVQGDRAYDSKDHRAMLPERRIEPVTARRNTEHGTGLGQTRWVVKRTGSWLRQLRRLRLRAERRDDIHEAFMTLGCVIVSSYFL